MAKKGNNSMTHEVVITPKGNYIIPTLETFKEQKAADLREFAAKHIQYQYGPNVPLIPSRAPWSWIAGKIMGMSDKERIRRFGTADVQTCIYTATSQYRDENARVSGNKTFRENPEKFGFYEVPMDSAKVGDLIQFTDFTGTPHHSTVLTEKNKAGDNFVSYSNGNTQPYEVFEGDTIWTMKRNMPIEVFGSGDDPTDDTPAAFRYIGSPAKQKEWTDEYIRKYNLDRKDFISTPTLPKHVEQPDATRIQKPTILEKGGFFEPKDAWDRLSMREKAAMIKVGVQNGLLNLQDIRQKYNEFAEGGSKEEEEEVNTVVPFIQKTEVIVTPDTEYNQYLNTLPDNQRFTPNDKYDSYLYWKLNGKPRNFEEAYNRDMFHYDHSDNSYHANSIAWGDDGIGYFMKPKDHDTVGYELDWFNKGLVTEEGGYQRPETPEEKAESDIFRRNYRLVNDSTRPNYYRYQPIKYSIGGPLVDAAMVHYYDSAAKWKHGDGGELNNHYDDGGILGWFKKLFSSEPEKKYKAINGSLHSSREEAVQKNTSLVKEGKAYYQRASGVRNVKQKLVPRQPNTSSTAQKSTELENKMYTYIDGNRERVGHRTKPFDIPYGDRGN